MCQDCCQEDSKSNSSFLFGLLIGALIASLVAILIYKNQKSDVFTKLKQYFTDLLSPYFPKEPEASPKNDSPVLETSPLPFIPKSKIKRKVKNKVIASSPPKVDLQGKIVVEIPKNLKSFTPQITSSKTKSAKMFRKA